REERVAALVAIARSVLVASNGCTERETRSVCSLPRLRGRVREGAHRYGLSSRSASACASFIAASADFAPVSAACRPSLSALVTRWLSWVESSATAYLS